MPARPASTQRLGLALISAGWFLVLCFCLFRNIGKLTGGHFVYALDDPYIHLALSEQLAHGHYGINITEFTSPSSSVLWPFLLVLGAHTSFHAYVPLLFNLIFGSAAALLLGWHVATWPPQVDSRGHMRLWKQTLTAMLLVFVANLAGLTFIGMEHVLQVLLSICCAIGICMALSDRDIPAWCLAAAVLAPAVRYEDLTLTLAVSIALVALGRWRRAVVLFIVSLLPLLVFSAYLRSKGLPALPMSVLVKGDAYSHGGIISKIVSRLTSSIHSALIDREHYPVLVLTLFFAGLSWQAHTRQRRIIFAGVASLGVLQLLIGRFGWFYRYEVYAVIFLTLVCLRVLAERPRFLFGYFALGLVFCASSYVEATANTSTVALEVYGQQYQMHRFVKDFYQGDYAVNDLGLVSFDRRPDAYVLDVYGLASLEASSHTEKSAVWLAGIVSRYHVPLAILYPEWFHIPASWTPAAKLCLPKAPLIVADRCVVFYITDPAHESEIRDDLQRFSKSLPSGDTLHIAHSRDDEAMWQPSRP